MPVAALESTVGPLLIVLCAAVAATAAGAPVVEGASARRPVLALTGGLLGLLSLGALALAFAVEAFCDGTCGRSASTLYLSAAGGLVACLGLAAAIHWRAPLLVVCLAILAGLVALGLGVATW
jgi:hypothetical protein